MNIFHRISTKLKTMERRHIKNKKSPVYYIIRRLSPWEGFFSNYFYVLSHIQYAAEKGWIPVVDMENYPSLYSEDTPVNGSMNAWEYYFRQPGGVSAQEAYASGNYVLSECRYLSQYHVPVFEVNKGFITEQMIDVLFPLQKECIPIHKELTEAAESFFRSHVGNSRCIGAHVRGTDTYRHYEKHSLPPAVNTVITTIREILESDPDCKILLCCDEDKMLSLFRELFGERVFYSDSFRSTKDDNVGIHFTSDSRSLHKFSLGKEVLMDCLMLSMCDYLICGSSNVASAATMLNNKQFISKKVYIN